ncbi:hypothetical protein DL770_010941 [Monosporascus sp. CRB-9-2]|nr:hypothetical protein DL770_010941 [Monosporascus sp. CRB-9-2]
MGVPGFRIFHDQEARPFNNDDSAWRVEGSGGSQLTARHGWDCPEDEGYWGYTTAAGGLNPYELNFLLERGSSSFVTAPHHPPPRKK